MNLEEDWPWSMQEIWNQLGDTNQVLKPIVLQFNDHLTTKLGQVVEIVSVDVAARRDASPEFGIDKNLVIVVVETQKRRETRDRDFVTNHLTKYVETNWSGNKHCTRPTNIGMLLSLQLLRQDSSHTEDKTSRFLLRDDPSNAGMKRRSCVHQHSELTISNSYPTWSSLSPTTHHPVRRGHKQLTPPCSHLKTSFWSTTPRIASVHNTNYSTMTKGISIALLLLSFTDAVLAGHRQPPPKPRHCHGSIKHLHLAVGQDASTEMTISFSTKWSNPGVAAPMAGIRIGRAPHQLNTFIPEHEFPVTYSTRTIHSNELYYSPFQHHITVQNLEPDTVYYYVAVIGDRNEGIESLQEMPLRDHPSQHRENWMTETIFTTMNITNREEKENNRLRRRQLSPPAYDGSNKACIESHKVRSFKTAPKSTPDFADQPTTFAIIGDLGQFAHSAETLQHMKDHRENIDAVILGGDIAYDDFNHYKWDTFFDFLDDQSIFDEVPLMVANGNHDIDKQEDDNKIFLAYESRFRMPRVKPAQLGVYDGPLGFLNMDAPPYPLPYEWGNAYYTFNYGPAKHIIISAYSSMEPGSTQYNWIVRELTNIDRSITPWLIVTIHVPIYNTFSAHRHDPQIIAAHEHLEPLFVEHHVNFVFTGHIHAYLRTHNVAGDIRNDTGPIHITVGAGGRQCDTQFKSEEPEEWVAVRDASYYGYGKLKLFNHTHAEWRWVPLSPSDDHNYNRVKGSDEQLPSLDHDVVTVENQFFIAQTR